MPALDLRVLVLERTVFAPPPLTSTTVPLQTRLALAEAELLVLHQLVDALTARIEALEAGGGP